MDNQFSPRKGNPAPADAQFLKGQELSLTKMFQAVVNLTEIAMVAVVEDE
jgi:hypothetical protein